MHIRQCVSVSHLFRELFFALSFIMLLLFNIEHFDILSLDGSHNELLFDDKLCIQCFLANERKEGQTLCKFNG